MTEQFIDCYDTVFCPGDCESCPIWERLELGWYRHMWE